MIGIRRTINIVAVSLTGLGIALCAMGATHMTIYARSGPPDRGLIVGGIPMAFETSAGFGITGVGFLLVEWSVFRESELEDQRKINFRLSEMISMKSRKE